MKRLSEPPPRDFDIYIPTEVGWAAREVGDSLEALYEDGYLPYSGAANLQGIFYRGRSARIILPAFGLSSENRRIARKFDDKFSKELVADFKPDEAFYSFCVAYFAQKHGPQAMPRERLETIMKSGLVANATIYHSIQDSRIIAYVLEVADGSMAHYWFSFYDLSYARQSLGLWLMLDRLRDAKARGLTHYYLGTVYGAGALYKTNFAPLEWRSEEGWNADIALLKRLSR